MIEIPKEILEGLRRDHTPDCGVFGDAEHCTCDRGQQMQADGCADGGLLGVTVDEFGKVTKCETLRYAGETEEHAELRRQGKQQIIAQLIEAHSLYELSRTKERGQ